LLDVCEDVTFNTKRTIAAIIHCNCLGDALDASVREEELNKRRSTRNGTSHCFCSMGCADIGHIHCPLCETIVPSRTDLMRHVSAVHISPGGKSCKSGVLCVKYISPKIKSSI